ncbi:MAG: hypothetical protein V1858_01080 [Candidatus Gottesmanbacteria bacterium]
MKIDVKFLRTLFLSSFILALAYIIGSNTGMINMSTTYQPAVLGSFDEYGYNRTARIFNGTGMSWCMAKSYGTDWCNDYLGLYADDKLVMKWNAEWDRGNAEGWSNGPYDAWENNEWNGRVRNGSGEVWHYKIAWDEGCAKNGTPTGTDVKGTGYCIWGQFAVLMSQGSSTDRLHQWETLVKPAGYGPY